MASSQRPPLGGHRLVSGEQPSRDSQVDKVRSLPSSPKSALESSSSNSSEIAEDVEALGARNGIGRVIHDAAGRAFRCSVWTAFAKLPEEDRPVEEVFTLDDG
jgi:hypothetical protein